MEDDMSIRDKSSPEAITAAEQFVRRYVEGRITRRTLPNNGKMFDEEKALESFKAGCNDELMQEAMKQAYDR